MIAPKALSDYKIILESYIGNTFNVTGKVTFLELTESINSYNIRGQIRIFDNGALMAVAPIIGQERVHITLQRDLPDQENDQFTNITMRVTRIANVQDGDGGASITLDLVDEKTFISDTNVFSRAMSGLDTDIIKKVYADFIEGEAKLPLNVLSKGTEFHSYVWPHMTPYDVFDILLKHSRDSNNSPMFLYDTLWNKKPVDRSKLISLHDILAKKEVVVQSGVVNNIDKNASAVNTAQLYVNNATAVDLGESYLTRKLIRSGAFGCEVNKYDISRKTIEKHEFKANMHAPLNTNNPYTDRYLLNNKSLYDNKNTIRRNYFANSLSFEGNPSLVNRNPLSDAALKSYYARFNNTLKVSVESNGNVDVQAGSVVLLDLDKFAPRLSADDDMRDLITTGKYVVTSLVHRIENSEYKISFNATRYGMGEEAEL